jgi:hypothetical protein
MSKNKRPEEIKYVFEDFIYERDLDELECEELLASCVEKHGVYWRHEDGSLLKVSRLHKAFDVIAVSRGFTANGDAIAGCDDLIYQHLPVETVQVLRPLDPCLRGLHHYWRNMDLYHKYWAGTIELDGTPCHYDIGDNTDWLLNEADVDNCELLLEKLGVEVVR